MGFLGKLFGKGTRPPASDDRAFNGNEPFMEHPTGEFSTALEAITSAFTRLESCDMANRWIVFSGQGQGSHSEAYFIADVRYLDRTFDVGEASVNFVAVLSQAGIDPSLVGFEQLAGGSVKLANAKLRELALFLNSLFTSQLGVRPFDGEDDYAVGAEWE